MSEKLDIPGIIGIITASLLIIKIVSMLIEDKNRRSNLEIYDYKIKELEKRFEDHLKK